MSRIITVSREFGSGGRELAKRLSDSLGIAYFDREIITKIAEEMEMDENYVEQVLEHGVSSFYPVHFAQTFSVNMAPLGPGPKMLARQYEIMRELAQDRDCIVVGRGADVIFAEQHPLRIFVHADLSSRVERCQKRAEVSEHLSDRQMAKKIRAIDRTRAASYSLMSSTRWGDKCGYDLCINTTGVEIKSIIPALTQYVNAWFER